MEAVVDAKTKGVAVPYTRRMGLSLFLGTPLDSTMTPAGISSIQATYAQAPQASEAQGEAKKKGSPSKLKTIATLSETPSQARERDRQMKG